jgi:uncharacterized Zn-binding protein involved in type VI secretion
MPGVALDSHNCSGHSSFPPRPNTSRSPNVFANGLRVVRKDDTFAVHSSGASSHSGIVTGGSSSVFVNGKRLARNGDSISCGSVIANGSPNVSAG